MPEAPIGREAVPAPRYEVVRDPADLNVMWDTVSGCPATADSELLAYETFGQAERVAAALSREPA